MKVFKKVYLEGLENFRQGCARFLGIEKSVFDEKKYLTNLSTKWTLIYCKPLFVLVMRIIEN